MSMQAAANGLTSRGLEGGIIALIVQAMDCTFPTVSPGGMGACASLSDKNDLTCSLLNDTADDLVVSHLLLVMKKICKCVLRSPQEHTTKVVCYFRAADVTHHCTL